MSSLQESYDHVIVGAGVAAASAVKGIRAVDGDASVLVLGAEPDPPLYRPDLSKGLWLEDESSLEKSSLSDDVSDAELVTDTTVVGIDPAAHQVELEDGTTVGYRRLLLATGAEPRTLDGVADDDRVVYYRTAADYRRARDLVSSGTRVVVVGGGYIGSEMAAALVQNGADVTMVIQDEHVQASMFPPGLAAHVTDAFRDHDVTIVRGSIDTGEVAGDEVSLRLEDGTDLTADVVVIGVGVAPSTSLAESAGLLVDDGVVVDDHLRASAADVYAAGDVASFPDALLGRRRVEHVDNAEKMGEAAGRIMAGDDSAYDTTPMFFSDLFDDGYEAVGEVSTDHDVVEDWKDDDHGAGVVYYLDGGRVRGVLLWNVWDSVEKATELISETGEKPVDDPQSLKGRIPLG